MTKVYVVTQGYYSAYRIVGLFSDKEKAEDLIKLAGGKGDWEEYDLEEYTLDDPYFLEVLKVKLLLWHVTMDKNGDNVYASQQDLPYSLENVGEVNFGIAYYYSKKKPPYAKRRDPIFKPKYMWNKPTLTIEVQAKSEKHAVKIVNEKRGQVIANNQWPEWDDETGKYKEDAD